MSTPQAAVEIDGFPCFAPERARDSSDYPESGFESLFVAEADSFWFRARQRIIEFFILKFLPSPAYFLEVGCGTGFVLKGLSRYETLRLLGAEMHVAGLKWARKRLPDVPLIQLDATRMPFTSEFDGIGAFDVIEHIEEDHLVMKNFWHALKPGGYLFLTVPQHMFLWSAADDHGKHKRRYSRSELIQKLRTAGFEPRFVSSFVFLMFPGLILSRKGLREKTSKSSSEVCELKLPRGLNWIAEKLMRLEEQLIFAGVSLPFGGSLIVVAQKGSN
jgi:SAM-dependent methyltransferase